MAPISFWDAIKSESPAPLAGEQPRLVRFGPLGLEPRAEYRGSDKVLYTFDQAQASVASRGLVQPTFRQVMEHVIVPGLEGKLDREQQQVFEDMFRSYGEWVDNAFYLKDGTLFVSAGIGGLAWNESANAYDATSMTVGEQPKVYDARGLVVGWNPLGKVAEAAPALVVDLYGRSIADLPVMIQRNAGVVLPSEGVVRPVGRGFVVNLVASTFYGAARGGKIFAPQETEVLR